MQYYEGGRNNQCMNERISWDLATLYNAMYIADLCSHMIILRIDLYRILKHQHLLHASFWIIQCSGEEQVRHLVLNKAQLMYAAFSGH